MPYYDFKDPQGVADLPADIDLSVTGRGGDDYFVTLRGGDAVLTTTFGWDPSRDETGVADVMSRVAYGASLAASTSMYDFVDERYTPLRPPSDAIRRYEDCKRDADWLRDGLGLSVIDISDMCLVFDNHAPAVKDALSTILSERAVEHAQTHPELPEGFVTIESLEADLDLGDYGDQCPDYSDDYITDCIHSVADSNVDIYTHDLLKWLSENYDWLEEADANGLLEGCKGDLIKMAQIAQYECYSQDMFDHQEDICKYATLEALKDEGVYAISNELAEALNGIGYESADTFSELLGEAKDAIKDVMSSNLSELLGDEELAADITEELVGNGDYGMNPCALAVEAVPAAREAGYAEQMKAYLRFGRDDASPSLGAIAGECRAASSALGQDGHGGHDGPEH